MLLEIGAIDGSISECAILAGSRRGVDDRATALMLGCACHSEGAQRE